MTVSAGKKTFKNLKLENYRYDVSLKIAYYVYDFNAFVTQGAAEGISKKYEKMPGIYQNLDFDFT